MQEKILRNVYWTFSRENYADTRAFNDAVSRYNRELNADLGRPNDHWQPDSIVINAPACYIRYEAWFAEAPELQANEQFADPDFLDELGDGDYHESEILARLDADNGTNISALEFLYKAQQQMADKDMGDHVFFEGAALEEEAHQGLPVYAIYCGS